MFACVGALGIIVNMIFFSLGLKVIPAEAASFFAFLMAATINYLLNSYLTFSAAPKVRFLLIYYGIASLFALLGGFFVWWLSFSNINLHLVQLSVIFIFFPFSYISHRRFSFPPRGT